jgi:hypothetical protein
MDVNGKDDIPYMKWTIKHVPNHQPDKIHVQQTIDFLRASFQYLRLLPSIHACCHEVSHFRIEVVQVAKLLP